MEWTGSFDWRGATGTVEVECIPNDDPDEYGTPVSAAVGFPVCTATVRYPRRGFNAMFVVFKDFIVAVEAPEENSFRGISERAIAMIKKADHFDAYERSLNRLTRTFAAQVEALKRYRSKGTQRFYVERVNVHEGGQAVVGKVTHGGRDGGGEESGD